MNFGSGSGLWRRYAAYGLFLLFIVSACESDGCDCDGFSDEAYPEAHYNKTVPGSAEIRLTSHGLDFMSSQVENLVGEFQEDGLSFCIPPTDTGDIEVCHEDTECDNGEPGCQVDLEVEDASLSPEDPNKLIVEITIGDLLEEIPVTATIWGVSTDCWLSLYGPNSSTPASIPATAPIVFEIDTQSDLNDLTIDLEDIDIDTDPVGYNLSGRGGTGSSIACGGANFIVNAFLDGLLRGFLEDAVDEQVDELTRDLLCRSCDGQSDCPSSATCEQGDDDEAAVCMYDEDECVQMLLGIEGALQLDALLGDFVPHGAADVHLTARLADRAVADTGLTLTARTGFQPETEATCIPVDPTTRPSFDEIAPSPSMNSDTKPNGEPFMFGLAVHQKTLQQMMWSIWASGGLCMEVGNEQVDLLTTSAIGTLIDAVDAIATRQAPVQIRLAPQRAPDVRFGANQVSGDEVTEGLLILDWKDLDIHMYGFVQERYARMFTLRVDLELPVAVVLDGDEGLLPVLGDVEEAIGNMRILNKELVAADAETFEELIPMLLGFALPGLMESLSEPIELPEFMGYRLVVEDGDLAGIDNNEYLGLFATLEYVGTDLAAYRLNTRAVIGDHRVEIDEGHRIPKVSIALGMMAEQGGAMLSGDEVEYMYRLNGGAWRLAGAGSSLTIADPVLSLQGEHRLELRARHKEDGARWQPGSTEMNIIVDYQAPVVEAWQEGEAVEVSAQDVVDSTEEMQMRYRFVVDGREASWSNWSDIDTISLTDVPAAEQLAVSVEVRDRTGLTGDADVQVRQATLDAAVNEELSDAIASGEEPRGCGGCAATGGAPTSLIGLLFIALGLIAFRRRRRWKLALPVLAALVFTASGCSGCGDETASQPTCPDECPVGEACVDGECVIASCDDADCSELICNDGMTGVCDGDQCVCEDFCADGCEGMTYCCYESNSCNDYPDACQGVSCDPGYVTETAHIGDADNASCEVTGAECDCVPMPPIDLRYHGSYPSLAEGGGVTAVSVHNIGFGDLMVGALTGDKDAVVEWNFVDGVPDSGAIDGDPSGPRDGIVSSGPEVGTHTATAVDEDGRIHVFYRHERNESLKYARGQESGGQWNFETTVVEDDDVDTGYYSAVLLRDETLHLFYTARLDDESSQLRYRGIDIALPVDEFSETEFDVLHSGSIVTESLEAYLPVAGLFLQVVEHGNRLFMSFYDNTSHRAGWIWENDDGFDAPVFLDEDDIGPYVSARPDFNDVVHVAFMDNTVPALVYRTEDGDREYITGGIRNTASGWSEMPVGHDVQLRVGGAGTRLVYHDASTHELKRATREGDDDWDVQTLAGEAGVESAAHGLYVRALPLDNQLLLVDFSVDLTGDKPVGQPTFRWTE